MPDQFKETKTTGYGSRIVNSLKSIVAGIILFTASFGLLYWNEGRVDLSNIAKTATEISSESINVDPALNGKLVSATGTLSSEEVIGDNLFLNPGKFIALEREVEMYAWVEDIKSTSQRNIGGSETIETTYTYRKAWVEDPTDSSKFKYPEEHENLQKSLPSYPNTVRTATLGAYSVDIRNVTLPQFSKVPLNSQNTTLSQGAVLANEDYIYISKNEGSTFELPKIGDLRVSYNVLESGTKATIFGKLDGAAISPYFDKNNNRLYRIFSGTPEEAVATLHFEYTLWHWVLRLIGFLMMWIGLSALFSPIAVLTDIVPIFGVLSRSLIGTATFLVALILTTVTILVSMLLHNVVALVVALVIIISLMLAGLVLLKRKKQASQLVAK